MGILKELFVATALATSVVGVTAVGNGCTTLDQRIRKVQLQMQNEQKQKARDIALSVHCVKAESEYQVTDSIYRRINGKRNLMQQRKFKYLNKGYGTAFAFRRKNGKTYLTTNRHVVFSKPLIKISKNFFGIEQQRIFRLLKTSYSLVDNGKDKKTDDDINVEISTVSKDKEIDLAVLKTDTNLYLSKQYKIDFNKDNKSLERVLIVGFPHVAYKGLFFGRIASKDAELGNLNLRTVIDGTGTFGSSGSPYFTWVVNKGRGDWYWSGLINQIHIRSDGRYGGQTLLTVNMKNMKSYLGRYLSDENLEDTPSSMPIKSTSLLSK